MAEGLAAALELDAPIITNLEKAQTLITQMANASEKLGLGFASFRDSFVDAMASAGGKNFMASFDSSGAIKSLQVLSDAVAKAGKSTLSTEESLNKRLEDIFSKRADSYAAITQRIKELKDYQDRWTTGNQDAVDRGDTPFDDTKLKKAEQYIDDLQTRLEDFNAAFDSGRADNVYNRALAMPEGTYKETLEKLKALTEAEKEYLKPGGDSVDNANIITDRLVDIRYEIDRTQEKLPVLKKAAEDALRLKKADAARDSFANAMGLSDSNIQEMEEKMKAAKKAYDKLCKEAEKNSFVKPSDVRDAGDEIDKLKTKYESMRDSIASADAADLQSRVNAILGKKPKTLEGLEDQKKTLVEMSAEIRRMNKNPFLDPQILTRTKLKIEEINHRLKVTRQRLRESQKAANGFKQMIGSAFNTYAVANFFRNLVSIRGEFEIQERSLAVIIKNANVARSMFADIEQIAVKSPFSVMDITKQVKQLAAYRIETDKLIEKTRMLGDISAGVGVDMNRLILAYGQVKAATFLKGQELRQFSEAGVNMLGGLAERFSEIYHRAVSTGEVLQMVSKRMVKFEDVDAVLQQQTSAGGTFYKMQEIQANTLQGAITNLKDRFQIAMNEMGKSYDNVMKDMVRLLEWLLERWQFFSTILVSGATWKALRSVLGVVDVAVGRVSKAVGLTSRAMGIFRAQSAAAGISLTGFAGKAKVAAKAAGTFTKALGWTNVVSIVASIGVTLFNAVRQANELRHTIKGISEDIKSSETGLVKRYNELLDVATDVTAKEQVRSEALEALKSEYGNILSLQDIELSNINEMNAAREEQIALIREYAVQQGKEQAMTKLIDDLNKQADKRMFTIWDTDGEEGLKTFISNYKKEVQGLSLLDEDDANAARNIIERKIIDGSITSAKDASDEFLRYLLLKGEASEEEAEKIINSLGDDAYSNIDKAFERVVNKVNTVNDLFEKFGISSFPKTAAKYEELINGFDEVASAFKKANQELFNTDLPGYKVALNKELLAYYDQVAEAIRSGEFNGKALGNIKEETRKNLQKALDGAWNEINTDSELQIYMNKLISDVNAEFPELEDKIGLGEMAFGDSTKVEDYADKIVAELEKIAAVRNTLFPTDGSQLTEAELLQILSQYTSSVSKEYEKALGATRTIEGQIARLNKKIEEGKGGEAEKAQLMALEEARAKSLADAEEKRSKAITHTGGQLLQMEEAWNKTLEGMGYGPDGAKDLKMTAKMKQARVQALTELGNKVLELQGRYEELGEQERAIMVPEVADMAFQVGLEPPEDYDLRTVNKWFQDNILHNPIIEASTKLKLELDIAKQGDAKIKDISKAYKDLCTSLLNVTKEYEDMDEATKEATKNVLQNQAAEMNKDLFEVLGIRVTLPDLFTPEDIRDWMTYWNDQFWQVSMQNQGWGFSPLSNKDKVNFNLDIQKLINARNKQNQSDGSNALKEQQNAIKEFITEVKKAKKEFGELDDEGDDFLNSRLNILAKKASLIKKAENVDFKNMSEDDLNRFLESINKLEEEDRIDVRLGWKKDDLAEDVQRLNQEISELWDKYDTSKKFEEYGINMAGMESAEIYNQILAKEEELRRENTDASIKAADDVKKKRLDILMREQEEAAKLIYVSQKEATTKVEQAYQSMYDDIAEIREKSHVDAGNGIISQSDVEAGVNGRIAQGMKEIAEAEWDAYKATEMYTMAFGDLDGLSSNVLEHLINQLEEFKRSNALEPSEIKTVNKAISDMRLQMEGLSSGGFFNAISRGFKMIDEASEEAKTKLPEYTSNYEYALNRQQHAYEQLQKAKDDVAADPKSEEAARRLAYWETEYARAEQEASKAGAELSSVQQNIINKLSASKETLQTVTEAYSSIGDAINEAVSFVREFADAMGVAFGDEANEAIDGFLSGFSMIGSALSVVMSALTTYEFLVKKGILTTGKLMSTMIPLLAAGAALGAVVAIIKGRDKALENQVESHKKTVEQLEEAYDDLSERMDEALSMSEIAQTYASQMANLRQQYDELNEAIDANNQRKQNDDVKEETEDLMDQLEDIKDKMKEANEAKMELLGAPTNYQDVANDWASSWLDAFNETGDGLDALEESFDELYDNIIAGQIQSLVMGPALEKLKKLVSSALSDYVITDEERQALENYRDTELAVINKNAKELAERLGYSSDSLSTDTLQKGIEGVTEQTAQALESILNSTRYYVADNNRLLQVIHDALTAEGGENTILTNVRAQTKYLRTLATIADSVYYSGSHAKGAGGIKVFVD